jgi:methyl-accepting chemotaxis protein
MLNKIDSAIAKLKGQGEWGPETDPYMSQGEIERRARMIREGYTQFKNETKTRSKPDQFHQAIREVKKKVQQINKMYEYVSRLKTELSEGEDGLKYKMHTEKALNKIKEMVSELNYKIKRFK